MENYEIELLLNPANLFSDINQVRDFVGLSNNLAELQAFFEKCEEEELFEYCAVIQNRIILIEFNDEELNENNLINHLSKLNL